MIQIKHFPLTATDEANTFIRENGILNEKAFHINTEGIILFYEDGQYYPSMRRQTVFNELFMARNAHLTLVREYEMHKKNIDRINADIEQMEADEKEHKKNKTEPQYGWKVFDSMKDNAKDQKQNAAQQFLMTKGSMDQKAMEIAALEDEVASLS